MGADLSPTDQYNSIVPGFWVRPPAEHHIIKGSSVEVLAASAPIEMRRAGHRLVAGPWHGPQRSPRCIKSVRQPKEGPKASSPRPPLPRAVSKLKKGCTIRVRSGFASDS